MGQDMDLWVRAWGKISCYGVWCGIVGRIWAHSFPEAMRMRMEGGKDVGAVGHGATGLNMEAVGQEHRVTWLWGMRRGYEMRPHSFLQTHRRALPPFWFHRVVG